MRQIRRTCLPLAALLLLACSSGRVIGPPIGVSHAIVMSACGPADGPAVAIYFTPEEWTPELLVPPYVGIYIAETLDALRGRTLRFSGATGDGSVWYQSDVNTMIRPSSGYLTITSIDANRNVTGTVDLTFPNFIQTRGEFHAVWTTTNMICP